MLGFNKTEQFTSARKELERAKSQVSALLLHVSNPTILLDDQFNISAFNNASALLVKEYFGWDLAAGEPVLPLRYLVQGQPIAEFLNQASEAPVLHQKIDCYNNQGYHIQLNASGTPYFDTAGSVEFICLSIQEHHKTWTAGLEEKKIEELATAFNHSANIGIALINENGYFLKTNDGYTNLLGYSKGELDGKHYSLLVPQENLQTSQKKFRSLLVGKNTGEEWQVIKKNGQHFTIFFTARLLHNNDKSKTILVTCRDMSETRHYQQVFSKLEMPVITKIFHGPASDLPLNIQGAIEPDSLPATSRQANALVIVTDKNDKTIWINEAVQKMTGYVAADLVGKNPGKVLYGKDTDKVTIRRIKKALKAKEPVSEIILTYKKDGSPIWLNMEIAPMFKDGSVENFIGICVDITELVNARESLKISEGLAQQQKLFKAIANNFPDGIIGLLDSNLVYIFAGGTEIKKLGLTEKDFIGKKIFNHITKDKDRKATRQLKKALAGEEITFEVIISGETYSVNAVPARLSEKDAQLILVVLHNITLQKKAESDLKETLKKEKELGELKTGFISMASHEFRTPLSTVLSSAYLIEKYTSAEEQHNRQKHLRRIISSVETLTEILEDFLSLGKIEEGKIQVRLTTFDLCNLVGTTISEMEPNMRPKQKICYWHHGEQEVNMDQSLLKHILMNLISNASKFSTEGSLIEINTFQDEQLVIVSVKDQGMGISKNDQKHLMERFFRGANAGSIQGTGLGLHIISKYAELMQGTVTCTSELGKGTIFTITFYTKLSHEKNPAN